MENKMKIMTAKNYNKPFIQDLEKEINHLRGINNNYLETLILKDKEIDKLKETIHRRNMQIKNLEKELEKFKEFARSEIVCECGKSLWLANFTNNPL